MSNIIKKILRRRLYQLHLLFLCSFTSIIVFSQTTKEIGTGFFKGYIINNAGDSLTGYINVPYIETRTTWVLFKPDMNTLERSYNPYELTSFGSINGQIRFMSVEVPTVGNTDLSFVRVIVDGLYDIYVYKFLKYDHVLLQGTDRKLYDVTNPADSAKLISGNTTISRQTFNNYLKIVFAGDPDLLVAVNSMEPSRNSIIKNVTRYYDQKGLPYTVYGIRQTCFSLGLTANVAAEKLFIESEGLAVKSSPSAVPYAGISLSAINRRSGIGAILESTIGYRSLHYNIKEELSTAVLYYEVFQKAVLSYSRLGLAFNPGSGKRYSPLIEAGAAFSALLSSEYDNYTDLHDLTENIVYSTNDHTSINSDSYYGGFIRAGVLVKSSRNNSFRLTAGYDKLWDFDMESISSVSVGFSYLFNSK